MRLSEPRPLQSLRPAGRACPLLAALILTLAGCAAAPTPQGINDPLEQVNRGVHGVNRTLDRAIVGPGAKAYGTVIPEPVRRVVGNLAGTLDLPGDIVNDVLQANPEDAGINSLRLATNLTMGVFGLFDAATAIGLPQRPTDFGETLNVWGAGEGVYLELPVFGPSTTRDAVGLVVDIVANPVRVLADGRDARAATAAGIFSRLGDRYRYSDTVESILYDSADSYAQARLLYLQNRRFALGQTADAAANDTFVDPYEDPYGQ
ncbi:MAG: VacJ family lipoprotein [Pseudomonadota bacterium]